MKFFTPRQSINKAYLKIKPIRSDIENFKSQLGILLQNLSHNETEEHQKNLLTDFFKNTHYSNDYFINTKDRIDLTIRNGSTLANNVAVIFEIKRTTNSNEMLSHENINVKALQELVLYYLRERITEKNYDIKHIVATNINEWFIFDANIFEKIFAQNKKLVQLFKDFENDKGKDTNFFYSNIANDAIEKNIEQLTYTYFDLSSYSNFLKKDSDKTDSKLIPLFKLLSPEHLLKKPFLNDSNSLNKNFYAELLHIIGLEEIKVGSKKLIERKKDNARNDGSLLESAILLIKSRQKLFQINDISQFGDNEDEQLQSIAMELVITWVNRILFLKLLEAQLIKYHKGDKKYSFVNAEKIKGFDELESLFFQVLAVKNDDRDKTVKEKFASVPYLNSSLFEPTKLEHEAIAISSISDSSSLPILSTTVLKDEQGKKKQGEMNSLPYLFEFLNAYDFTSDGGEEIQEDNKALISASVLGLIFEKINGYKDGSFFTPSFVTMYMCREVITQAVLNKFKESKGYDCFNLIELHNQIDNKIEANQIINSLKICDPAVGSGHFLVSALNEIIYIKSALGLLFDKDGKSLKSYDIDVVNDELIITNEDGEFVEYFPKNKESQRLQEAIFNEKQTIIENCLFGVDINPNSVKICRLRLWIELLKNAYYKADGELETLPNIDINIKVGDSLVSKFNVDSDLKDALKKNKFSVTEYKQSVQTYKNATSKIEKHNLEKLIKDIKTNFKEEILNTDSKYVKLRELELQLIALKGQSSLFELDGDQVAKNNKQAEKIEKELNKAKAIIAEVEDNKIFQNAFEWRFEFPEVLNEDGNYVGFDVVIGNPPYIYRGLDVTLTKEYFKKNYKSTEGNFDLYKFFIERIHTILKENGTGTYIVSNTFLSAKGHSKLREFLIKNFSIKEIYELGLDVFDNVLVENVVFNMKKEKAIKNNNVLIKVDHRKVKQINDPTEHYLIDLDAIFKKEKAFNIYLKQDTELLVNKIRQNTLPLENIAYVTVGINTGYIKDKLVADSKLDDTYHKVINGKDIAPFAINWGGEWIKYDKDYVDSFGELGRSLPAEYIFNTPKILVQRTRRGLSRKLVCAFDDGVYYNLNRLSNIVITNNKFNIFYLLALLNSKLLDYYFNVVFNEYEVKPLHLSQLPIKNVDTTIQAKLADIVNEIQSIRLLDSSADISKQEKLINQFVYELYEMTADEISVIESL